MTNLDGWEQQSGGLWLKVSPFDTKDQEHREYARHVLRGSIQTVAQTHGASFDEKGFKNNQRAIGSGDLWVDLYLAKWDVCESKVYLGATFQWETYGFTPNGSIASSVYTEDVCVLRGPLRQLIRSRPEGKEFPKEGITECLERISLNQMRNDGVVYRFGEVDRDNTTMMRQLNANSASMGTGTDSAVLEFKNIPTNPMASWLTPTWVYKISRGGMPNQNNFFVAWKEGEHDIRFLVTKGRATAAGQPRADIRPWHNGNLPEQGILENVIASALIAIKREVEDRRWSYQDTPEFPVPMVPLSAGGREKYRALYDIAGNEAGLSAAHRPRTFDPPAPDVHVFVQGDERMLKGFLANQAMQRLFGEKPMIPGINILKNEMQLVA